MPLLLESALVRQILSCVVLWEAEFVRGLEEWGKITMARKNRDDTEMADISLISAPGGPAPSSESHSWYSANGRGYSVDGRQTEYPGDTSHVATVLGEDFYSRERCAEPAFVHSFHFFLYLSSSIWPKFYSFHLQSRLCFLPSTFINSTVKLRLEIVFAVLHLSSTCSFVNLFVKSYIEPLTTHRCLLCSRAMVT